jgi:hypothetical protein
MKRLLILAVAAAAVGIAWYQAGGSPRPLAQLLPSGALVYLEAKDFSQMLSEWDSSVVKRDWLNSANYSEFERSNLYLKLNGFYKAYGAAAGFLVDMASLRSLAGDESALALYDLQTVQFAYITRIPESKAAQSRLWLGRASFQQRQAAGITFYTKTAENVEVAFALANGYLLISSGEDRMAGMLGMLTGKDTPSISGEGWYKNSTEAAGAPGELRLAMNLEALVENTYFRSYWVQRNVTEVRPFLSGVADVTRTSGEIREQRLFLKRAGLTEDLPTSEMITALSGLSRFAPDDAGLYRAWAKPQTSEVVSLIESHILNPRARDLAMPRYAPMEDGMNRAGNEGDLESHIDEPPLPKAGDVGSDVLLKMLSDNGVLAMIQVQSSMERQSSPFIKLPCAIGLTGRAAWNGDRLKQAIGGEWTEQARGGHTIFRDAGLRQVAFSADGPLLIIANDGDLLLRMLDRQSNAMPAFNATYAAHFRHERERTTYGRLMTALDFAQPRAGEAPPFFSGNIASLSATLRRVSGVEVVERTTADRLEQRVVYQLAP